MQSERPHWLEKYMMQVLSPWHHLLWVRYYCRYQCAHLSARLTSGFYIHSCQKMKYKGGYSPSYLADPVSNDVTNSFGRLDSSAKSGKIYVVSFGRLYSAIRKVSLCRFRAPRTFIGRSTGSWRRYDWMIIWYYIYISPFKALLFASRRSYLIKWWSFIPCNRGRYP